MDVEHCKSAWSSASNDTERFAVLFVVHKFLKSARVTDDERRELFEHIGFNFLKRLLLSDVPAGCPPDILKAVSLSILSSFVIEPALAANTRVHSLIPILNDILAETAAKEGNDEVEPIIIDAITCLISIVLSGKCTKMMFEKQIFSTVVNIYCDNKYAQYYALLLLMHMVVQSEVPLTEEDYVVLNKLLKTMAQEFATDQSLKKFELNEHILYILLMHPTFQLSPDAAINLRIGLTDILRNKIKKEHREVAIKLSGLMLAKFGNFWFVNDAENSKTYFTVLVQIISVEMQMLLEGKSVKDIEGNAFLLTACYKIMECVISTMVGENWFQSNRDCAAQLLKSLESAMFAVIDFLRNTSQCPNRNYRLVERAGSDKMNEEQVLLATIRVLCAWLSEETFALQDEVREILPFILSICQEWFEQAQNTDTELDPLRFLIAPLCHLAADDSSRQVLLENNILDLLSKYLEHHWLQFNDPVKQKSESETVLTTVCGIFLNIVVLEPSLVIDSELFFSLLKYLFSALPTLSVTGEHLTLRANFSVLGLLIAKQCHKKVKSCETSFYRFLSSSIKFLWDAYHVEDQNELARFVITRHYRDVWPEVNELWFIGMQALSTLLEPMPWIASFLDESGWPVVIVEGLSSVGDGSIEASVKYAYQALLCPLIKISPEIAESLITHEALAVAQKHELRELELRLMSIMNQ